MENDKIKVVDAESWIGFEKKLNQNLEKGFIPKFETFRRNIILHGNEALETFTIICVKTDQKKFDMNNINKLIWG